RSSRRHSTTNISCRGWAIQPVNFPAVLQNYDRLRACRHPCLVHNMPWKKEVPAFTDLETLAGIVVLEKMRPAKNKVRFALFMSVLRYMECGREVDQQCRCAGGRVNAKNCVQRGVFTEVWKHHLPLLIDLIP